jgi:hypothetical protein
MGRQEDFDDTVAIHHVRRRTGNDALGRSCPARSASAARPLLKGRDHRLHTIFGGRYALGMAVASRAVIATASVASSCTCTTGAPRPRIRPESGGFDLQRLVGGECRVVGARCGTFRTRSASIANDCKTSGSGAGQRLAA